MVVSRQLDRVRVAQNHCQGLQTDRASYAQERKARVREDAEGGGGGGVRGNVWRTVARAVRELRR